MGRNVTDRIANAGGALGQRARLPASRRSARRRRGNRLHFPAFRLKSGAKIAIPVLEGQLKPGRRRRRADRREAGKRAAGQARRRRWQFYL